MWYVVSLAAFLFLPLGVEYFEVYTVINSSCLSMLFSGLLASR